MESPIPGARPFPKTICVDIGNSGLRLATCETLEGNAVAQAISHKDRILWAHSTSPSPAKSGDPKLGMPTGSAQRWLPGNQDWLTAIQKSLANSPATWFVSSVRRDAARVLQQAIAKQDCHRLMLVQYSDLPMKVDTEFPERVGIDRLLAAFAAAEILRQLPGTAKNGEQAAIVIQAGSAVTVDRVSFSSDRIEFQGGAILPGVPMMLRLLGASADLLPVLEADDLTELPKLPGRNTEQAMLCGTASALVGGVLHLVQRYRQQAGDDLPVILSGGDGMRLVSHLPQPVLAHPDLVLQGLFDLAAKKEL